ncbi:hypothetical protein ANCCAN_02062 [Ancylostoma caninum]|uniref:Uncharacterized protein n=1 Tax=Ancylostoma caninum TaxID=29170 RepID=A0A368H520_ANCCA|nr:hypothetical protein ANCCAN_02062 [Ancylostoma caninum]
MSKRTFIPKWNPHRRPPVVFAGRRRSFRNELRHSYQTRVMNPPADDAGIRWYGDPFTQGVKQAPRISNERLTQRVGLFRNAKHSEVVINDLSVTIKKAVSLLYQVEKEVHALLSVLFNTDLKVTCVLQSHNE